MGYKHLNGGGFSLEKLLRVGGMILLTSGFLTSCFGPDNKQDTTKTTTVLKTPNAIVIPSPERAANEEAADADTVPTVNYTQLVKEGETNANKGTITQQDHQGDQFASAGSTGIPDGQGKEKITAIKVETTAVPTKVEATPTGVPTPPTGLSAIQTNPEYAKSAQDLTHQDETRD